MKKTPSYWLQKLGLAPHPEGGWYRETYRASEKVRSANGKTKSASTAIYFLLEGKQISKLHRIASDELWHFYDGGTLIVSILSPAGEAGEIRLGKNPEKGEMLQAVVPAGFWFGAALEDQNSFALVGCTVAPGFEFSDLEFPDPAALTRQFPKHKALITKMAKKAK